ncbi:MAG: hypothetical protein MR030_01265 [Bacteroidales bacterium]|nr:hypothetical protein [Bacteroidales bacterium]
MNSDLKKILDSDTDGLVSYEYLANHIDSCQDVINDIIENIIRVDKTGQFDASTARYLNAIDKETFAEYISRLIAAAIEKDREHRYLGDLLQGIWGEDYAKHVDELNAKDDNFRRIYKRLFPKGF